MAPKKQNGSQDDEKFKQEQKQESSKAAQTALAAQRKAQELTQAAAGAGDPKERQKLLNEALKKEIESESFGKTARYLNSGSFQGLLAGSGLGTGIGAGLGTLTGVLVGGTTSIITGGLGGAAGTAVGALHGPWFKMENVAGDAVSKLTGTIPGWEATKDQKKSLEKMIMQVNEQDTPTAKDLEGMSSGADSAPKDGTTGDSFMPAGASVSTKSVKNSALVVSGSNSTAQKPKPPQKTAQKTPQKTPQKERAESGDTNQKKQTQQTRRDSGVDSKSNPPRSRPKGKPRKLQVRSQ